MSNKKTIRKNSLNKYILKSSEEIGSLYEENNPFVDLIITSPPYFDAKKYTDSHLEIGVNQTYKEYLDSLKRTFEGLYAISKESASLYLNIDTLKRNGKVLRLNDDVARVLEEIGWIHQDTIIWDKVKTLPYARKGQSRNVFEYILYFTKDKKDYTYNDEIIKSIKPMHWWFKHPEKYSPKGVSPSNIWSFSIPPQGSWGSQVKDESKVLKHACPFPPEMLARIILLSSNKGDIVVDPYAGTGISLEVAKRLDRNFLGFDISSESEEIFYKATSSFVEKRWDNIVSYYKYQSLIKPIYYRNIILLRVLKYVKILNKEIEKNNSLDDLNVEYLCIDKVDINFNHEKRTDKYAKVELCYISKNEQSKILLSSLIKIIQQSKLKKFGLEVVITVKSFGYEKFDKSYYFYREQGQEFEFVETNMLEPKKGRINVFSCFKLKKEELNLIWEDTVDEDIKENYTKKLDNLDR
ncbi:site-specific DNA-methyltransferase [uncultured Vagococcus sp.]|uniref:DNA-methyltransferase n=1 Tax=uncultured Vagococcus sp. TaxID=189676 RepID=UPI0028D0D735|nr:site-specific DNA-methyltransferase [uncultured Vagococcus sp.]